MEFKKDFDFKKVSKDVFEKLKHDDIVDYDKIEQDKNAEEAVKAAMKETYDETIKMFENANSLEEALAHFSPLRRELIKSAFRCQSFHVDIQRQADGTVNLLFESMSGSKLSFLPSVVTLDESNYKEYDAMLIARIILEIILIVLSFIGVSSALIDQALPEALQIVTASIVSVDRVLGDVTKMVEDAKKHAKEKKEKKLSFIATDVIGILIDIAALPASPIIRVFKLYIQKLSWFSIVIIICQALCFIVIATLSGGAAILAKVISWVLHASFFFHKLTQKNEFDAITMNFSN